MQINKILNTYNGQIGNTIYNKNLSKSIKHVEPPKRPELEFVKEDYNPFKLIYEELLNFINKLKSAKK